MGRPQREIFGETVAALADTDPRIYVLDGDVGSSTRADIVEKAHPDRYLQMGIAEQNMLGVAAGHGDDGPDPVHQHLRVVRRRAAAGPGPGPDRPDRRERQDHAELRRPVHRPDGHEPHHRGRLRDHARDAGHGDGVAVRRHRGRRGRSAGPPRYEGPCYVRLGRDATPRDLRRRPRVRVRQGRGRPRGRRRDADLDRRPDGPDPPGRGPPGRRGRRRPTCSTWPRSSRSTWRRSSPPPSGRDA